MVFKILALHEGFGILFFEKGILGIVELRVWGWKRFVAAYVCLGKEFPWVGLFLGFAK